MSNIEIYNNELEVQVAKAYYALSVLYKQNPLEFFIPHFYQVPFFKSQHRNKLVLGGNRSGKTECGADYILQKCLDNPGFDTWAVTWADLSIPVQQKKIYNLMPKDSTLIEYGSFTEQRGFVNKIIIFKNGSMIRFKTYEQGWESFQGTAKDLIWNDEEAPEEIIKEERARLIDKNGELIRTMTPLNGLTYTYDEVLNSSNILYWYWKTKDNISINQEVLNSILETYSEKEAEVRSDGTFMNLTSGLMYYSFTEENVVDKSPFGKEVFENIPIDVSCDFNVNFMNWNLSQSIKDVDYEFDNVCLDKKASTRIMCSMIKQKYSKDKYHFNFYGDIAGKKGSTVTSESDWSIIEEEFPGSGIYYQHIENIGDRVSAMNGRLCNAKNERKIFINRKGNPNLINDLRRLTWEIFLSESLRRKNPKLTHPTDGASYKYFWKYPQYGTNTLKLRRM